MSIAASQARNFLYMLLELSPGASAWEAAPKEDAA